ncbi:hypothetical protein CASFOL_036065 [Castilleja foliolosa]|uniref:Uncharacterized protein n=1 Tax=Castilleja foliolosa TaxID=1961234 RepID=A0ABD3BVA9_9LAMI
MEGIFRPEASNSDASSPNIAPDESTAWTNEKHSLYLHHLELSFVTQLHQSKSLLHMRLSNVKIASEKFKDLRNDCCQASLRAKMVCNFKRVGKNCHSPSSEMAGSTELWSTEKHRKSTISSGLATCSQDLLDVKREGTGQNFFDEVNQSTSVIESQAKRSNTALVESSLQDQFLPQIRVKVLKADDSAGLKK